MTGRSALLTICAALLSVGAADSAAAQDLGETVQIESAITSQQVGAERTLSNAIQRRMQAANGVVQAATRAPGVSRPRATRARAANRSYTLPANIDVLAGTDAPTYRLRANGAVIRVSSGLIPSRDAVCIAYCPQG